MTNLADCSPCTPSCTPHPTVPSRLIARLLARLPTLRAPRVPTLNPEDWPAYMRRDVGLSDHGGRAEPDYPTGFDWPPR